jgi:hypothetical protein
MPTFYMDPLNGNDSADGSTFALGGLPTVGPWLTFTTGATAARIAPGDLIKIAKSPDPTSLGNGTWTNGPIPSSNSITAASNATPIVITCASHGYATGDVIFLNAVGGNLAANGVWVITWVSATQFSLDGSVGSGAWTSGGTCRKWNSKVVKLATACTLSIDDCDTAWTTVDPLKMTCTLDTADWKSGYGSAKFAFIAAAGVEKLAYRALPASLNLSGYQRISFWIKTSVTLAAGDLVLKLCSDATGDTPQNTFSIPATPTYNVYPNAYWTCFTIDYNAAMYNGVASISLWQAVDKGAMNVWIDNITACKDDTSADSLSLTSLISKNSLAQGGTEGWYCIQSIKGAIIVLDNTVDRIASQGLGYTDSSKVNGNAETVTTYKRECFRRTLGTTYSTVVQQIMDSGSLAGGLIDFEGGYNTSSGSQDGETWFDGGNGNGYGIYGSSNTYVKLNRVNAVRYYYPIFFTSCRNCIVDNVSGMSGSASNVRFNLCSQMIINVINANNSGDGLQIAGNFGNRYGAFNSHNNMGTNAVNGAGGGLNFRNILEGLNAQNNQGAAYSMDGEMNILKNFYSKNNYAGCNYMRGVGYLLNAEMLDSTEVLVDNNHKDVMIYSSKHDATPGNHWIFCENATINLQTATKYGTIGAWRFIISSADRDSYFPVTLQLLRVLCVANKLVTFKCWVKKDHATNVAAQLIAKSNQLTGMTSDATSVKANDTNWQELTLTFTPTEAGPVTIEGQVWYVTGNSNAYFDSEMTCTIAP